MNDIFEYEPPTAELLASIFDGLTPARAEDYRIRGCVPDGMTRGAFIKICQRWGITPTNSVHRPELPDEP